MEKAEREREGRGGETEEEQMQFISTQQLLKEAANMTNKHHKLGTFILAFGSFILAFLTITRTFTLVSAFLTITFT